MKGRIQEGCCLERRELASSSASISYRIESRKRGGPYVACLRKMNSRNLYSAFASNSVSLSSAPRAPAQSQQPQVIRADWKEGRKVRVDVGGP